MATFLKPVKVAIGPGGELYVSDALAAEVRKIEIAP
jgi:hypothetical protein